MKLLPALLLLLLAAPLSSLQAQDLPRAKAEEETAVRALIGKKSVITGKVTGTFESPKGMTFINLDGGKFTVVAWKESYDKFEGGSPAKLYKGKTIEVTGQVFEFRPKSASKEDPGKLEIKLTSPEQIKILTAEEPATGDGEDGKKDGTGEAEEKSAKDKKESRPAKEEKTGETTTETKAEPDKGKPDRVDSKKFFK